MAKCEPYFISDLHLGHANILQHRPTFSSIEEHDKTIMDNIRSRATRKNVLYILGDILKDPKYFEFIEELSTLYQHVNIILGNHDSDRRLLSKMYASYHLSDTINQLHSLTVYQEFLLSHAPVHPQELRDKINIHGHTHTRNIAITYRDGTQEDDRRYFNVSCENINYTPISLSSIREHLRSIDELPNNAL